MLSVSRPPAAGESDWIYGGYGNSSSMTGQYAGFVSDNVTIQKLIDAYAGETDRRQDIIGFRCVPFWVRKWLNDNNYLTTVTVDGYTIPYCAANLVVEQETSADLAGTTLACGYTPRNKKCLPQCAACMLCITITVLVNLYARNSLMGKALK